MKERPILFSGPMVRAILDGTKTQTRRVVKAPPVPCEWPDKDSPQFAFQQKDYKWMKGAGYLEMGLQYAASVCPHGQLRDKLWVRETWQPGANGPSYRADFTAEQADRCLNPWKPSIFMPRWASRITLEITEVRVQRLQDIGPLDAKAEGIEGGWDFDLNIEHGPAAVGKFKALWDSINAKRMPWDSNPFVWAISFRRIDQ